MTVDIPRHNVISKDIKLDCNTGSTGSGTEPNKSPNETTILPFLEQTARKNFMVYKLTNCKQTGHEIECYLEVKSENKDDILVIFGGDGATRIVDANSGFEYYCSNITIADLSNGTRVDKKVTEGVPVKVRLIFSGIKTKLGKIALLDVSGGSGNVGWYNVEFRNIQVR
ncbi:MAG: hypothetical protein IPM36_17190 [Lewinellaceae bacterium]|nr:hypothetical protein [Lewinellaceae bacterium]